MKLKILATFLIILTISSIYTSASETITSEYKSSDQKTSFSNTQWEQINEDGFGTSTNIAPRGITVFNNSLIIGTDNVIDFWAGLNTSLTVIEFVKSYIKIKLWKNFQSNGCEIWSYNGTKLRQIVGNGDEAVMKAGFGNKNNSEVGVLIPYKGYLYAGLHNHFEGGQIWRTRDINEEWEQVVTEGFGDNTNAAVWVAEIFNDTLYIGTMNLIKGFEIYRTDDGLNWEAVVGGTSDTKRGFGTRANFYAWSMCVYDDSLFVGTDNMKGGGELWKTSDGSTWEPVLAYMGWIGAKLHGADYPRGFDGGFLNYRGGIRKMIVYNNELYCGFCGEDVYFNVWLSHYKLFSFRQQGFLLKLRPFHYRESQGLEIWKYNATADEWKKSVGGTGNGNFSGGFGDIRNEYPWSMTKDDNFFYVGTLRIEPTNIFFSFEKNNHLFPRLQIKVESPVGGAEVWRFDGQQWKWELINEKGFGDLNNIGIRGLTIYKDCLIAATLNLVTGCELWKYNLNEEYN
jgi:hypothetical protein